MPGYPFVLGVHHLHHLTASVGIAVKSPGERPSAERLLNEADTAMYRAKRSRKAHHKLYLDLADADRVS